MLLKNVHPYVRQVIVGEITARTEYDVFFKLKTPDSRLYYIIGGSGKIIVEGEEYAAESGTIVLFRGGTEYSWNPAPTSYIKYLAVNFDYTDDYSHISGSYHPVHAEMFAESALLATPAITDAKELDQPIVIPRSRIGESPFRALLMEYSMGGELSEHILSSMLKSLLLTIVREQRESGGELATATLAADVLKYLQENYSHQINYETLGAHFHMSPIYLNRVFRQHLRTSLHEYLLNYRISAASAMLRSSNATVKEIALSVGFTDVAHFSKSFKRITGHSPKSYRVGSFL